MGFTPIAALRFLADNRMWHALRRALAETHAADIAELIGTFDVSEQVMVLRLLGRRKGEVFSYLGLEYQRRLIQAIDPQQLDRMISQMSPDDRTRLLEKLPEPVAHALIGRLPPSEVKRSLALLSYPENTAGRYMTPNFVAVRPDMTAAEALQHVRTVGRGKETLNVLYIVDEHGHLEEDLRLGSLPWRIRRRGSWTSPTPASSQCRTPLRRRTSSESSRNTIGSPCRSPTRTAACSASSPWTTSSTSPKGRRPRTSR